MSLGLVSDLITGAGVAGVWLLTILSGLMITKGHHEEIVAEKDKQIAEWKEAARLAEQRAETERRRAEVAVDASNTNNVLLAGLQRGISSAP